MTIRCRYKVKKPGLTLSVVTKIEQMYPSSNLRCYFDEMTYQDVDQNEMSLIIIEQEHIKNDFERY